MEKRDFLKLCLTGGVAASTAAVTARQMAPATLVPSDTVRESAFERVMRTQTLRCGYLVYAPNFMVDPNTRAFSGIFHELTEKMGEALGLKVEWVEEGSLVTLIESLRTGRIDVVASGLWSNAIRAKVLDFSRPVFFNTLGVYVRADDARFDKDLSTLNNTQYKIAVIDGEMADQVSNTDFPKAGKLALPQLTDFSQLLLSVATRKADATIAATHEVAQFERHNPGKLKKADSIQPIRTFPNVFLFNKGEDELADTLNGAIDEMEYKGTLDSLIDHYEEYPGSFYRVARPYRQYPKESK